MQSWSPSIISSVFSEAITKQNMKLENLHCIKRVYFKSVFSELLTFTLISNTNDSMLLREVLLQMQPKICTLYRYRKIDLWDCVCFLLWDFSHTANVWNSLNSNRPVSGVNFHILFSLAFVECAMNSYRKWCENGFRYNRPVVPCLEQSPGMLAAS